MRAGETLDQFVQIGIGLALTLPEVRECGRDGAEEMLFPFPQAPKTISPEHLQGTEKDKEMKPLHEGLTLDGEVGLQG